MTEHTILDQPWQIELYRLNVLKQRLRIEIQGMTFRRGSRTTLQAVNETLIRNGYMDRPLRSKQEALGAIQSYIAKKEQEARDAGVMS
jgi:hypothetical protein